MLSPFLLRLAQGKHPDELLFEVSAVTGQLRPRQAMHRTVQTICEKAGVPRVCTHSLRGLWATLAVKSGAVSHAVAESLGHHSFAVTQKYYAQPVGVNPVDAYVRAGTYVFKPPLPYIPGQDGAGVVRAVGADVRGVAIGDRVFFSGTTGATLSGSYAELVVCEATRVFPLLPTDSAEEPKNIGAGAAWACREARYRQGSRKTWVISTNRFVTPGRSYPSLHK